MKVAVEQFKDKCAQLLHDMPQSGEGIELTENGRVIAFVTPNVSGPPKNPIVGSLMGTVTYHEGWDDPLGDEDWEACR